MNRRRFMSMALKAAGLMAIAPVLPFPAIKPKNKLAKKSDIALEVCHPEHTNANEIIPPGYPTCENFRPHIAIQVYSPGEPLKYQDLGPPSCKCCMLDQEYAPNRCDILVDPATFKHKRRHYKERV